MQDGELEGQKERFKDLAEQRSEGNQEHGVQSIVAIAIWGAISGADNWVAIEI